MIHFLKSEVSIIKQRKTPDLRKIIWYIVLITLIFSIGFTVARLIFTDKADTLHNDYVLMLVQCCLGIAVLFVPDLIQKKFSCRLPSLLTILYYIFLYCAIYLGEVRSFYYVIPFWDSILHGFSAGMLGVFGFWLVDLLNQNEKVRVHLSPLFVSLFAFCFAVTVGAVWEIYEFTGDALLGLNMQKFRLSDGTVLIGHAALGDTMKDIIIDSIGALVIAVIGFINNTCKTKKENV